MDKNDFSISLSPLDEQLFGITTAKAQGVTVDRIPSMMAFCRSHRVTFLIARCLTTEWAAVQAMERLGFSLMDTLVYYHLDLSKVSTPSEPSTVLVRPVAKKDVDSVCAIAASAFKHYPGHYHADPRLERAKCVEVYTDWARRLALSDAGEGEGLVGEWEGRVVGFQFGKKLPGKVFQGLLTAVDPAAQNKGIHYALKSQRLRWCQQEGIARYIAATQLTNLKIQKEWARRGYELFTSLYTFHKWFDC